MTKIGGVWATGTSDKIWDLSATGEANHSNLVHNLGLRAAYTKKQRLGPKLAGVWARGASKNLGPRPPTYFCNR